MIRSFQKISMKGMSVDQQEAIFFNDFITLCRGHNTPSIQYELDDDKGDLMFSMSEKRDDQIDRWMARCFPMTKNLFALLDCLSRLRADKTRGPIVFTFCSVVIKDLRRIFYPALDKLEELACKNLLTLQRKCEELNSLLGPLKEMAIIIEDEDKVGGELLNFLISESHLDSRFRVINVLKDVLNFSMKRYTEVLYEWVSQGTLTLDLAHEFFIWDLSKSSAVSRSDFPNSYSDGSEFDKRFVMIPEMCPDSLKPVASKILDMGKFLFTMKKEHADTRLLVSQLNLDEIRYWKLDTPIAKLLPGMNSTWIEELVVLYEEKYSEANFNRHILHRLLSDALEGDWLKEDKFNDKFALEVIPQLAQNANAQEFELRLKDNPTLFLAFPEKILEPYQRLFRLSFLLHRARYLLHRKRFVDKDFVGHRAELVALFLIVRFVHVYHNHIFVSILQEVHRKFLQRFREVKNLDDLVEAHFEFLSNFLERTELGLVNSSLADAIQKLVECFIAYAKNEFTFEELNERSFQLICNVKRQMVTSGGGCSILKNLLFGINFGSIGIADKQPLWRSLRHVEPMKQQQ
uniref:Gamma-tubulin complex component n=1 Tax=Ditylenchus dipsaci TaxID=166011 RepID=A0A915D3F7_9BILA